MPFTGFTAFSRALKMSTTPLSLRMIFWRTVRKVWRKDPKHDLICNYIDSLFIAFLFVKTRIEDFSFKNRRSLCNTHLELLNYHEAEETVEPVQAERAQSVLDLGKQPVIGHFLVRLHVIPGVHLIYITRCSKERGRITKTKMVCTNIVKVFFFFLELILHLLRISDP